MSLALLILGVVLFVGLVVVHEWGHFIAARRGGVDVEEFGIGFPPKVWARKVKTKKSKFDFSINALPLGGFVRLKGESDADTRPHSYGAAPLGTKVKIMTAGVVMNLLVAVAMFTALAWIGMPKIVDNQYAVPSDTKVIQEKKDKDVVIVGRVPDNTPASKVGIKVDDRIISLNGVTITDPTQVGPLAKENAGKTIPIVIKRGDQTITKTITLNTENNGQGYLGIVSESGASGVELQRSTWSAPVVAVGITAQFTKLTFQGLGTAISSLAQGNTEKASEQVSGPVGIAVILKEGSKLGLSFILMIIAIISLTLAIMNILPIPALDGGRLFVTLFFHATKQKLTPKKEEWIHGTGFVALIGLMILITFVDVNRFF